jgi:ABC-type transport system involved in multi-copper enzyme maturation permease subunit
MRSKFLLRLIQPVGHDRQQHLLHIAPVKEQFHAAKQGLPAVNLHVSRRGPVDGHARRNRGQNQNTEGAHGPNRISGLAIVDAGSKILGMYRTFVIVRHTFLEAVVQPIYSLVLALGAAILLIFAALPFFTLGEDTVMFKAVGLDVVLLLVLVSTLFATSRSIYEEIEDRTMLTLMSKPLHKWEVLVGKFLGIVASAAMAVGILGVVLILCTYWRIPTDYMLRTNTLDERELRNIWEYRMMHISGLLPSLVLVWLQIAVLAALGVALSTRFSLVVNLPVVILLYIAGNLTRFLFPMTNGSGTVMDGRSVIVKAAAYIVSLLLPYLQTFDLRPLTVYKTITLPNTQFAGDPQGVALSVIWGYVGLAVLYAVTYSSFALSAGMFLFEGRELGGAEG